MTFNTTIWSFQHTKQIGFGLKTYKKAKGTRTTHSDKKQTWCAISGHFNHLRLLRTKQSHHYTERTTTYFAKNLHGFFCQEITQNYKENTTQTQHGKRKRNISYHVATDRTRQGGTTVAKGHAQKFESFLICLKFAAKKGGRRTLLRQATVHHNRQEETSLYVKREREEEGGGEAERRSGAWAPSICQKITKSAARCIQRIQRHSPQRIGEWKQIIYKVL